MRKYVLCVRGCGVFSCSWLVLDCWPGGWCRRTRQRGETRRGGKGLRVCVVQKMPQDAVQKSDGKKRASVSGSRVCYSTVKPDWATGVGFCDRDGACVLGARPALPLSSSSPRLEWTRQLDS